MSPCTTLRSCQHSQAAALYSAHTCKDQHPSRGAAACDASERSCRHIAWQTQTLDVFPRKNMRSTHKPALTGQTSRPTTRPETHQNLIHTDKEQTPPKDETKASPNSRATDQSSPPPPGVWAQSIRTDDFSVTIFGPTRLNTASTPTAQCQKRNAKHMRPGT
jgi:hypothetical protein